MTDNSINPYSKRAIARITLEAKTPLALGSGDGSIETDSEVATDINGLPYIPATSIAGVLRHAAGVGLQDSNNLWGFQKGNDGHGSQIIFSEGRMVGKDGKAIDGLADKLEGEFYGEYKLNMPIRQHVRIGHKGVAEEHGKFDNRVVFKGTHFIFEVEIVTSADGDPAGELRKLVSNMRQAEFRLGGGTRNGYGQMAVVDGQIQMKSYDLTVKKSAEEYLSHSAKLSDPFDGDYVQADATDTSTWQKYTLTLTPEDFFLFGSGRGDDEADMTAVTEKVVTWKDGVPSFDKDKTLIPATSVKGALAHRTAFHYNKLAENFADKLQTLESVVGPKNKAVQTLFGYQDENGDLHRGNVIFSDLFEDFKHTKILNHVAIDRFTGGAIDGALFSEKVTYGQRKEITLEILVNETDEVKQDPRVLQAFHAAIADLCNGLLPLGGGVCRGNGTFTGRCEPELEQNQ